MKLLNRLIFTIKANINSWLEEQEDPQQIIEDVMEEMQQQLIAVRQAVAGAIATQKRTEREIAKYQAMAQKSYERAQLAVNQEQEKLAREALHRRQEYQHHLEILETHRQQQQNIVMQLRQQLRELEQKISAAKLKKDMYLARARSAMAAQKLQELTGDIIGGNKSKIFEKMEAKVLELEAETELIMKSSQDSLEEKFDSLEAARDIEIQLAQLKANKPT
jgi:phage shock protein A